MRRQPSTRPRRRRRSRPRRMPHRRHPLTRNRRRRSSVTPHRWRSRRACPICDLSTLRGGFRCRWPTFVAVNRHCHLVSRSELYAVVGVAVSVWRQSVAKSQNVTGTWEVRRPLSPRLICLICKVLRHCQPGTCDSMPRRFPSWPTKERTAPEGGPSPRPLSALYAGTLTSAINILAVQSTILR
jgi:hypothetical protein